MNNKYDRKLKAKFTKEFTQNVAVEKIWKKKLLKDPIFPKNCK